MNNLDPIEQAIQIVGLARLARELQISHQAIRLWQKRRRMPRTEWTGETAYSEQIARLTDEKVTRDMLLAKWPAIEQAA